MRNDVHVLTGDPTEAFVRARFGFGPSVSVTVADIARGLPLKVIAARRGLSVSTVRNHATTAFLVTATNTNQAIAVAVWRAWTAAGMPTHDAGAE